MNWDDDEIDFSYNGEICYETYNLDEVSSCDIPNIEMDWNEYDAD